MELELDFLWKAIWRKIWLGLFLKVEEKLLIDLDALLVEKPREEMGDRMSVREQEGWLPQFRAIASTVAKY